MKTLVALLFGMMSLWGNLQEQREFYEEHGYLWIKNFYSPAQVHLLEKWAEDIHEAALNDSNLIVVPEANNPQQICRAEDLLTCYPNLHHFIIGTVSNYLSLLLERPHVLFKDKINFKWPGGGAFAPHQDFPAFELFGPRNHITAMVCIDPATPENGCLHVDAHWTGGTEVLPYIVGGMNHGSIQPEVTKEITWLPVTASPRDLVIFTSFLPHYSEPNESNGPRRAMFFTLNELIEGSYREAYYHTKRADPQNPLFHFATPTNARTK